MHDFENNSYLCRQIINQSKQNEKNSNYPDDALCCDSSESTN